jgi:hypothetical protein
MANDGRDLARPPITVWSAAAKAILATRLRGTNLYSMGAGGFAKVPAIPQLNHILQPANPNSPRAQGAAQIYSQTPLSIKQRFRT